MCIPNMEYQYINPTTQVALFSACLNNCTTVENITWNIYQGSLNSSSNITQWTLFNQMNSYRDIWFFGKNICLVDIRDGQSSPGTGTGTRTGLGLGPGPKFFFRRD
jgi:hypothetical protein